MSGCGAPPSPAHRRGRLGGAACTGTVGWRPRAGAAMRGGSPPIPVSPRPRGLLPRDLTMNVVLPEVDGRLVSRAVSFKAEVAEGGVAAAEIISHVGARPETALKDLI